MSPPPPSRCKTYSDTLTLIILSWKPIVACDNKSALLRPLWSLTSLTERTSILICLKAKEGQTRRGRNSLTMLINYTIFSDSRAPSCIRRLYANKDAIKWNCWRLIDWIKWLSTMMLERNLGPFEASSTIVDGQRWRYLVIHRIVSVDFWVLAKSTCSRSERTFGKFPSKGVTVNVIKWRDWLYI